MTTGVINPIQWSPDSRHFLVPHRGEFGDGRRVGLFANDGSLIRSYAGFAEVVWLDSERLVLSKGLYDERNNRLRTPSGHERSASFLASLSSPDIEELEADLGFAKSNGHGALAVGCLDCSSDPHRTRVWSDDGSLSKAFTGYPLRWSMDGTRLLLEHPVDPVPYTRRWPEIRAWPGMRRVWADRSSGGILLDPNWQRFAQYDEGRGPQDDGVTVEITQFATGEQVTFTAEASGLAAWDAGGRLVIVDYDSKDAFVYAGDGALLDIWEDVGDDVTASLNGSTLAFWYSNTFEDQVESRTITLARGGHLIELIAPAPFDTGFGATHISPDGRHVAILVFEGQHPRLLLTTVV